jgi:hypothetical protein
VRTNSSDARMPHELNIGQKPCVASSCDKNTIPWCTFRVHELSMPTASGSTQLKRLPRAVVLLQPLH